MHSFKLKLDKWGQGLDSPRMLVRLGAVIAVLLVGTNISLFIIFKTAWQRTAINDIAPFIASLLAFCGLAYGAYRSVSLSNRLRLAWRLFAIAALGMTIGNLITFTFEVILHRSASPSIADLFYLSVFPLFLAASILLLTKRISAYELERFGLDVAVIVLSSTLVLWKLIIDPVFDAGASNTVALIIAVAYPVGELILIWAAVLLILRPNSSQPRQPVWLLLSASILIIIGDVLSASQRASATFSGSDWQNIFYTILPLILMLSGLLQAVQADSPPNSNPHSSADWLSKVIRGFRVGLPYIWLGGAYLVLSLQSLSQNASDDHILLSIWVAVIIGLIIVRQVIELNSNKLLTVQLHQLNTQLENRVFERTEALAVANDELRKEMSERVHVERVLLEREEKLAHNATHDALTGLPNRTLLMDHLSLAIRRLQRQKDYSFALLFLDLDGFKVVNDSLGHLTGDRLLVEIAHRLRSSLREIDSVARLGGDEFVVLVEDVIKNEAICRPAERLQEKLSEPFEIDDHRIFLTASIGVVSGDENYQQPDEILRDADLAMYEAKAQGRAQYVVFTPELRTHALERLVMESDLRAALERDEFVLYYQPILALDTNKYTGFEALIRWQRPGYGLVPPMDFIPTAEASGLIVPITAWVLGKACSQMRAWQIEIPDESNLAISVNLSPKLFSLPELPKMVDDALAASGLSPSSLKLEITESTIVEEAEETKHILQSWREKGIQVHMDDFGTGYSSLSYLHHFPIDTLKIDRAFINHIQANGDQSEIVRTIIALARELNISVVAEGVETIEQLEFLKRLGCQAGQGFYISYPLESEEAGILIRTHKPDSPK
jgi:diguanylate cyclase (GGDEF)-like protein